jgi:hypothetical protein
MNTDPAAGRAVDLNAKFDFRLFAYGSLQEFVCDLGSCTDAGRDRVPPARSCDCSRGLLSIGHHRAATGVPCIVRARAASITRY